MLLDGDTPADWDYDTVQARTAEHRPSSGQQAVFDDYCNAVGLLTKYNDRPTLAERVQAALDERDRLQAELDAVRELLVACKLQAIDDRLPLQGIVDRLPLGVLIGVNDELGKPIGAAREGAES